MDCSHKVLTDREAKAEGSGGRLHIDKGRMVDTLYLKVEVLEPAQNKAMIKQLLSDAWEWLKLTWAEWHSIVIGWGDGVAFTKTHWEDIEDEEMRGELHYYKFGTALGRLTWALIIASLLIRWLG